MPTPVDIYKAGNISLGPVEMKRVDFSYKLPEKITGDHFGIRAIVATDLGEELSWMDKSVDIEKTVTEEYVVQNTYFQIDNDKRMALADGPIIKKDRPIYLYMDLINPYPDEQKIALVSSVHKKSVAGEIIKEYSNDFTLSPGINKNISFMIQVEDDLPGVYEGVLRVKDSLGTPTSQLIIFHYIVDGSMVNIHSVEYSGFDINNFALKKDDEFSLTMNYSGEAFDIIGNTLPENTYLDTSISAVDENGKQVVFWSDKIDYNKGFSKKIELVSMIDTNTMDIDITVSDEDDNIVANYKDHFASDKRENVTQLTSDSNDQSKTRPMWKWVSIVIITIILIISILLWIMKKNAFFIFMMLFLPVFGFVNIDNAEARKATLVSGYAAFNMFPTLNISNPPETVCAGEEFIIEGSERYFVCSNGDQKWRIVVNNKWEDLKGSWTKNWFWASNAWHTYNFSIKEGWGDKSFTAPSEIGTYYIYFDLRAWARSWDPATASHTKWKISYDVEECLPQCTGTIPMDAIKCPEAETDLTESYEWSRAVNDQCLTENKCDYYYTTKPQAIIDTPTTDPAEYTIGDNVDFTGRGILGSGGGSIDQYAWINVRSGTPSYDNKNKCAFVDTVDTNSDGSFNSSDALRRVDTNATSDSFSTSTLPLGTHRVCLNVRQEYNDGSTSWAGSNVAFRDIVIKEPPCTYSCGAPQSETPQACEESDCNGGAGCGAGYECAGNKAYQKNKTFCYESACGSNLVDNSNCGGSCNPSGVTEPATCACEANQNVNNWIEVPTGN
jgi:hypothetical protein